MEKIKGAIFDLDGTLFDSLWVWEEIDKRFLSRRGIEVPSWYSKAIGAMNFREAAEFTIKTFGLNETPELLMQEWMDMARSIYANEIKLKPMAKEFLFALKSKGIKLSIATSSTRDLYMPALIGNGVDELFTVIMDTSETKSKEFPDIYLKVAKFMGLDPSECVVFEDLPVALWSAKRGGFKTVAVYDRHSEDTTDVDLMVNGYEELIEMVP